MPPSLTGLEGRRLPGGSLTIEPHEATILDRVVAAPAEAGEVAHPVWFVIISLRCLGISIDELCALAAKGPADTLMVGEIELEPVAPLLVGRSYRTEVGIASVSRRSTRDGSILDTLGVRVEVRGPDGPCGTVTSTYLFKRGGG
jgi:hypothetical protein